MKQNRKIRYAVVGSGHITQVAVLPAFGHANRNSELVAIVSGDPAKRRFLKSKYDVEALAYEDYDGLLQSGKIDAVYIALPNSMHCDYTVRAARAGVHVLCEKPMAVTEAECCRMIEACARARVKLMIAYRLHFEEANMKAVQAVRSGRLGAHRFFNSVFSMQVRRGNIRLKENLGGGALYDIGVYCINAARYLFQSEPYEVFACQESGRDQRFKEVEETTSAILRFPCQRLASFTISFGASDTSAYQVVGTQGSLRVDPAYEYVGDLAHFLSMEGKTKKRVFSQKDQFAAELAYFSDCVLKNKNPEPSGKEGLADVRIVQALLKSAAQEKPVAVNAVQMHKRPRAKQIINKPPVEKPKTLHVESASGGP